MPRSRRTRPEAKATPALAREEEPRAKPAMQGSELAHGGDRAAYIQTLFDSARTAYLLQRRNRNVTAQSILDALVAWDSAECADGCEPGTLDLSRKYNQLLDGK
jgi:hypothetical protein